MDWVRQFYKQQDNLANVYTSYKIRTYHHEKASLIKKHHSTAKSVLELGAGGGQVACATAMAGYEITAIELIPAFANHIQGLAETYNQTIHVINTNFYDVEINQQFDIITYWDGFGIGSDDDQVRLLKRCANWLKPDGMMLVDIYTPWYWAKQHNRNMQFGDVQRRYEFDEAGCRMLDTWWHTDTPDRIISQSLRCYSPADLRLILKETPFEFVSIIETGGCLNKDGTYIEHASLNEAMSYTVKLNRQTSHSHKNV